MFFSWTTFPTLFSPYILRHSLAKFPRLAWNFLCIPGRTWICNLSISAFWGPVRQVSIAYKSITYNSIWYEFLCTPFILIQLIAWLLYLHIPCTPPNNVSNNISLHLLHIDYSVNNRIGFSSPNNYQIKTVSAQIYSQCIQMGKKGDWSGLNCLLFSYLPLTLLGLNLRPSTHTRTNCLQGNF